MGRRAVAATLVSFVVFTSLFLANSALYSTANSSLGAAVLSAAQVQERANGQVLVGLSVFDSLTATQEFLQSNPADCSSPSSYLGSVSGTHQESDTAGAISSTTETSWVSISTATGGGGPAILGQFAGYANGELNLQVTTSIEEHFDSGLPSLSIQSILTAHLPVPLDSTISRCQEALADLDYSLSTISGCNSTSVYDALGRAESMYPLLHSLAFGASATPQPSGCLVAYWVTITEAGLEGPTGEFQWSAQGEGSVETSPNPGSSPSSA